MENTKSQIRVCCDCGKEFTIDEGDLVLYKKVGIKIPHKCFFCRMKQHAAFWVFGKFRKGKSDLSGDSIITVFPSNSNFPIYSSHEWWGDNWDAASYGIDYDSQKPFFEQFENLQKKVPHPHQAGKNNLNCDWCDDVWESKNCYLCRSIFKCENINYGYRIVYSKDSFDLALCFNLDNSYDCLECHDSFNLNFSENSRDCIDSYFLFDCRNCHDCFMCWNLRNKKYCIRNKQYEKDEYEKEIKKLRLDSFSNLQNLKYEFINMLKIDSIHRENSNLKTTNSVGNYLTSCDKCINMFAYEKSQNCRNQLRGFETKDCIDQLGCCGGECSGNNSCYVGGVYGLKYSIWSSEAKYSEYLDACYGVDYCFGCVGLKKKKYCILNKQYDEIEYNKLKSEIIKNMEINGEYGQFPPYSMGYCDYNFSVASVYFPEVTKEEIIKKGGHWSEENVTSSDGIPTSSLPDSIFDTPLEISLQPLICPKTQFRFNISGNEYGFHKRKGFALPRNHFDFRILEKARKTAILKSYPHTCFYCKKDIMAYYPPEWGYQKIACEDCYKRNIA